MPAGAGLALSRLGCASTTPHLPDTASLRTHTLAPAADPIRQQPAGPQATEPQPPQRPRGWSQRQEGVMGELGGNGVPLTCAMAPAPRSKTWHTRRNRSCRTEEVLRRNSGQRKVCLKPGSAHDCATSGAGLALPLQASSGLHCRCRSKPPLAPTLAWRCRWRGAGVGASLALALPPAAACRLSPASCRARARATPPFWVTWRLSHSTGAPADQQGRRGLGAVAQGPSGAPSSSFSSQAQRKIRLKARLS